MTTAHRITTTTAVLLSLAAAGASSAVARPADDPPLAGNQTPAALYSRPDKSMIPLGSPSSAAIVAKSSVPSAAVRIQAPQSGFDWGDAGIGAAGGVALALLGVGGAIAISQRRPQRTRHTTTLPN